MTLKSLFACILAAGIAMSAAAQDLKPVKDRQTQKYGYQAKDKSWAIEPAFDNAKRFVDGYAEVTIGEHIGLIDANGDWVFPAEYDDISKFYKNGLCELMRKEGRTKLRGAGDQTGRIVVPVDCQAINIPRKEGLITAKRTARGGALDGAPAWGVYDQNGREIFAPQFASAPSFRNGVGIVKSAANGLEGVISEDGRVPVPFEYLSVGTYGSEYISLSPDFTQTLWDSALRKMRAARLPGSVKPYDPQGNAVRAAAWHSGNDCIGVRLHRNTVKKIVGFVNLSRDNRVSCQDVREINWGRGGRFLRLEPVPFEHESFEDEEWFGQLNDPYDANTKYWLQARLYEADGTLVEVVCDAGSVLATFDGGLIYRPAASLEHPERIPLDDLLILNDINTTGRDRFTMLLSKVQEVSGYSVYENLGLTRGEVMQYMDPVTYSRRLIEIAEGDNVGVTSYQEPDMAFLRSPAARDLMRAPLFRYPYHMGEVLNCSVHVRSGGIDVDLYENLICRFEDHIENPYYRMSGQEEIYWGPNNARTVRLSVEPVSGNVTALEDDITKTLTHYQIVLSLYEEDGSWLRTLARADYADYVQDGVIVFDRLGIAVVAPEVLRRAERFGRISSWSYTRSGRDARGDVIHTLHLPNAERLPRTLSALEQAAKGGFSEHRFSGRHQWGY
jgi:hypothetical protein